MHFLPINSCDLRNNSQQYMVIFLWGCTTWISSKVVVRLHLKQCVQVWVLHYREDIVVLEVVREGNRTGKVLPNRGKSSSFSWSRFFGRLEVLGCAWVELMKCLVERRLLLLQGCSGFQHQLHGVTGVINSVLIINVFPLHFGKLQSSKQFAECVCIMRCSNIMTPTS